MISQKPFFPDLPDELRSLCEQEGVSLMGVAPVVHDQQRELQYQQWIDQGYHGSMQYMQRHTEGKYNPARLLSGCRCIIVAGLNYYQAPPEQPPGSGKIARYAWGRDYHKVLGKRLLRLRRRLEAVYPDDAFRNFTDATPLAERYYAELAGIGFQGRNTLLISGQYGSWFVLGEILSTRLFGSPNQENLGGADTSSGNRHGACPRSCTKCIDVCPTGALYAPHRIDASRCISYLTIEHKGSIPEDLRDKMGDWLFGCDLCQEVCPLNIRRQVTSETDFLQIRAGSHQNLTEILSIQNDEQFTRRYAGSPLMRAKRTGLLRNACIAAANTGATELLPRLRQLASEDHETDAIIREHAWWAVCKLTSQTGVMPGSRGNP